MKILDIEIRNDIKNLDKNPYFGYLLKSSYFKITKNKYYSLDLDDIIHKMEISKPSYEPRITNIKGIENFLKDCIINDLKIKYSQSDYKYDVNIIYTSFPIFLSRKSKYPELKLELVAICEVDILENYLAVDKVVYIFCNDKECLQFISSTTIRENDGI